MTYKGQLLIPFVCVCVCVCVCACRFLILDPHYTGREDVKTVTDKVCACVFVYIRQHTTYIKYTCRDGVDGNLSHSGTNR